MKRMRKLIMLTAIMFLAPAVSQAKTLEELLVEKGVITKGEATKAAASAPGSLHYSNGVRWDFSDKNVSGSLSTMIRTRWTFTDYDKDDAVNRRNTSSFDVTQARLTADGTVLDKEFAYHLMGDFAGDSASLKDAYITYQACDWADVSMGQHRTGISRQFNTDENNWTFPDESAVSSYFNLGRQAGAWASLKTADMPLTFSAGLYNGESPGEGINKSGTDTLHTGVFAARYDVAGKINSMVESDIDNSEELGASVGAAVAFGQAKRTGVDENDDLFTLNLDAIAKYQGWSFGAEYYYKDISNDAPGTDSKPSGFYAQVGYFLMPSEFELAARYGLISCDDGTAPGLCAGTKNYNEVDLSANYYFWGNNLKAQLAWARLGQKPEASSGNTIATDRIILAVGGVF
ncbi:MAG: hypothetical protein EBZ48_12640 [Proteobacteria bacterium]|nr:hypothetical protein [Pseudomonadota bacterium]